MPFGIKCTEPSGRRKWQPPGWKLPNVRDCVLSVSNVAPLPATELMANTAAAIVRGTPKPSVPIFDAEHQETLTPSVRPLGVKQYLVSPTRKTLDVPSVMSVMRICDLKNKTPLR